MQLKSISRELALLLLGQIKKKDIKLILPSSSLIFKYSKKKINENSKIESKSFYSKFRNHPFAYDIVLLPIHISFI